MCGKEGAEYTLLSLLRLASTQREQVCVRLSRVIAIAIEYFLRDEFVPTCWEVKLDKELKLLAVRLIPTMSHSVSAARSLSMRLRGSRLTSSQQHVETGPLRLARRTRRSG